MELSNSLSRSHPEDRNRLQVGFGRMVELLCCVALSALLPPGSPSIHECNQRGYSESNMSRCW